MRKYRFILGLIFSAVILLSAAVPARADSYREFPYDTSTPWTNDDVDEMLDYATQWVGRIDYASSQNNTDPDGSRFEELHDGGATDCSWFVYHVLFRYGLLNHFVHSYEWGNAPDTYPGGYNIGNDINNAVPGDIFATGTGTKPQNSHVMIYLGDGKVVECASGKGGVVVSNAPHHIREIIHFACIPTHEVNKAVDTE